MIDAEQRYDAFLQLEKRLRHSHRGSMHWKRVKQREYLYHKVDSIAKSLGPRSADTETTYRAFVGGRDQLEKRLGQLDEAIRTAAPIDRAMGLGRVPETVAKVLRRLHRHGLLGNGISVVGTNALFAYERMAGGHFHAGLLATGDIDLLLDARQRLRLLGDAERTEGIGGILKKVDSSFEAVAPGAFRAINDSGLMIDLIQPMLRQPSQAPRRTPLGSLDTLVAVEIEGLQWLQNSPQKQAILLDERGFPLPIAVPDPRAFALHKLWVSERADRDPLKVARDRQQAEAIAQLVQAYLPAAPFDDESLSAVPLELRKRASELLAAQTGRDAAAWQ